MWIEEMIDLRRERFIFGLSDVIIWALLKNLNYELYPHRIHLFIYILTLFGQDYLML